MASTRAPSSATRGAIDPHRRGPAADSTPAVHSYPEPLHVSPGHCSPPPQHIWNGASNHWGVGSLPGGRPIGAGLSNVDLVSSAARQGAAGSSTSSPARLPILHAEGLGTMRVAPCPSFGQQRTVGEQVQPPIHDVGLVPPSRVRSGALNSISSPTIFQCMAHVRVVLARLPARARPCHRPGTRPEGRLTGPT